MGFGETEEEAAEAALELARKAVSKELGPLEMGRRIQKKGVWA
jgi:hypothetical protein